MRKPVSAIAASLSLACLVAALSLSLRAQDASETANPTEAPPAAEQPARPAAERPTVDYQATEQISEDLSVSFPIDI